MKKYSGKNKGFFIIIALVMMFAFAPKTGHTADKKTDNFWHGALYRSYDYYIPESVKPSAPVLLVFHGIFADSDRLYSTPEDLPRLAEEHGFVVMWMESGTWPARSWNAGPCCLPATGANVDDVGYTLQALDRMRATVSRVRSGVSIDDTRIYALGHSNGGSMVHRLALQRADVFAAILPISFPVIDNLSWNAPRHWTLSRKVPVLAMHAVDDGTVRYDGGLLPFFVLDSAPKGRDTWAGINGCAGADREGMETINHPTGIGSYTQTYKDCGQNVSVSLLTFPEGGHRPWFPETNGGVDVQRDAWAFFSQYQKPGHQADRMWAGQELYRGQYLTSADKKFRLGFQADSNLVLTNTQTNLVIWHAGSNGSGADKLVMQGDGNLVLWRPGYWGWKGIFPVYFEPRAVWSSNTAGSGESRVQVSTVGKLQIIRDDITVWTKG